MKRIAALILVAILALSGCTMIQYKDLSYLSIGQDLTGLKATAGDATVEFDKRASDIQQLIKILEAIGSTVR